MIKWIALFLLIWFLYHIREIFPPFVVGGIFAYLLLPLIKWVSSRLRIKPALAVFVIYMLILGGFVLLTWSFGPLIINQMTELVKQRQEIAENLITQIATTTNWQTDVHKTAAELLISLEQNFGKPEELMHMGGLLSKSLLAILVTTVTSIYFIVDSNRVGQFFLRFIPSERRETIRNLSGQMNVMLSRYVRGQLLLITIMSGVAYFFLHFIFHIKYALLIAIASGFLEIIPVLGPIMATTIATIFGFAQGGVNVGLWIILCYTLARWTEDYVIIPKIIGHAVELHPLAVIFAVLCGEVMAGALGMLIAIPVAASIKVILDFCYPPLDEDEAKSDHGHGTSNHGNSHGKDAASSRKSAGREKKKETASAPEKEADVNEIVTPPSAVSENVVTD